jgi:hypothetical protein
MTRLAKESDMTRTAQPSAGGRKPPAPRWRRAGALVVALVAIAALATACSGGGSHNAASPSSNATSAQNSAEQSAIRFESCIRAHGISNFPDSAVSVNGGQLELNIPLYLKSEPQFQSALQACQKDLPRGGASAKHVNIREELMFARCMRSHGIINFPDPLPGGGFNIPGNTNSPQFEAADNACQARSGSAGSAGSNGS